MPSVSQFPKDSRCLVHLSSSKGPFLDGKKLQPDHDPAGVYLQIHPSSSPSITVRHVWAKSKGLAIARHCNSCRQDYA